MANRHQQRMLQFIEAIHEQVSTFARARFQSEGRGMTEVVRLGPALEPLRPGGTDLVFHTVNEIRRRTAGLTGGRRDEADILLRMIETYDPTTQAVVMTTFEGENPVSLKVRLTPVRRPEAATAPNQDFLLPHDRVLKRPQGVYR